MVMNRGKFLTDRRLLKGLSQSYIAEKLGYSPQTISQWENDKGVPELSVISRYASLLGIDLTGFILCKNQKLDNNCEAKSFNISKFAANLKFIRKKNNLYQKDISKKLLVNTKTIASWEKGLSTPTLSNFVGLCSYLKLSYDELYFAYLTDKTIKQKPVRKKRIFIPIILPILVVVSAGGTSTAIAITNNQKRNKEQIPEHVHVGGEPIKENVIEPTCLNPGSYDLVTYCLDDNAELSRQHIVIDPLNHDYVKISETESDYEHDGIAIYSCTRCGDTYQEKISDKLEHSYSSTWTYNEVSHWHNCLDDGYETYKSDEGNHIFSSITTNSTYDNAGQSEYTCTVCGYSYIEVLPKKEHLYSDTYSYNDRYHYHACIDDGYEDLFIDKEEHVLSTETVGTTTTISCSKCDYEKVFTQEYAVINAYDSNEDGIIQIGNYEDIYLTILNVNNEYISTVSLSYTNTATLEKKNFTLFNTAGGNIEVIDEKHLKILKEHFSNVYFSTEKTIELSFTKINDVDLPDNSFTFIFQN